MKRTIVAAIAGLAIAGGVFASAASLGGVSSANVGSSTTVVASCDTDGVKLDYKNAWDAKSGEYQTQGVEVSGIADSCKGQAIEVSLRSDKGDSVTTERLKVEGGNIGMPITAIPAEAVTSAAVIIGS
jgi:hypothetical protein